MIGLSYLAGITLPPSPSPSPGAAGSSVTLNINLALTTIIWLPVIGAVLAALLPARTDLQIGRIRAVAFAFVAAPMAMVLWIYHNYQAGTQTILYEENYSYLGTVGSAYHVGVDGLNAGFLLLTSLVFLVAILASWHVHERVREYFVLVLVAFAGLNGVFSSYDLFTFLLFWTVELVPTFLLLAMFGGSARARAAWQYLIYAAVGSAALAIAFLVMYLRISVGSFDLSRLAGTSAHYAMEVQVLCLVLMLIGFGMRLPLVPLHRWFVEVMTEATAPVALMVAGAGAATATYGLLRFGMYAFPDAGRMLLGPLLVLALLSMVYGAFLAIRQDDLRRVVAYVFVAEGGIILLGISGASESGFAGAVFGTIARGLGAGALVLLIAALQDRFRTRSLALFGGLATRLPSLFGLWLLAVLLGAGVPASAGFVGNVVTVMGAFPVHHRATVVAVLLLGVLLAILLWVLHRIFLQPAVDEAQRLHDATSLERWAVGLLLAGSLYIGIFPQGPLLAENHLMEPGLMNAVTDGVRQIADRYVHGATSALP